MSQIEPMGKAARLTVLVLAALTTVAPALAATNSSPAKPDYSKEAAVIESYRTTDVYENDGTGTEDITVRVKVLSAAGVQQYGVLVFTYPSASEHMKVDYVRVRQPDGTVVTTPPSSMEDVTPPVTRAAPEYSDFRQKHVAVKGLVPGSELEYHVHFRTYAPLIPGQFWLSYDFSRHYIVLDEELEVSVPKDRAVKIKSAFVQPTIVTQGDRRIYLWKNSNLKDHKSRQYPAGRVRPPDVLLSTFQSWAQVGAWWRKLEQPQAAPTPDIRAETAKLTKGLKTEQQKLQAIYSYVAQQFRYISVSFGIGRYRPHSASQVLSNGYGDCKDKETLLASLLRAADIPAWPALMNATRRIDPDVPSPGQFDHVISVVPEGSKLQWMDTTSELAPMGLLVFPLRGKQALVIPATRPAYLASTPAKPSVPNRVTFIAKGKLASDGTYTGKIHYTLEGDDALAMRLIFNNVAQADWQKTVQAISRNLSFGGTVSNVSVSSPTDTAHPFTISYDYVRKNYSDWDHQKQIVPPLPMLMPGALPDSDKKKPQPYILGDPEESHFHASMALPKGYTPALPKAVDVTTPFGDYHAAYSFKDGVLTTDRRMSTTVAQVPVAELENYRKFQKTVSGDVDNFINLKIASGSSPQAAEPPSPEVLAELRAAYQAGMQQDERGALEHVNRALKLDPKVEMAWLMAASLHMDLQEPDDALAAARKAVSLAPKDFRASMTLARMLWATGKKDAVVPMWRSFVQSNPQNARGHAALGSALMFQKKYSEAIPELQAAARLAPQSWRSEMVLGEALEAAKRMPQAAAAYEEAVALHPGPEEWNDTAYALAEANVELPKAEDYALRAVKAEESKTTKIALDNLTDSDLRRMSPLASYWDTLAWVYFREGKLAPARQYEAASFALMQYSVVGDHLGQIEEKLGHRAAAVRDYAMAYVLASSQKPSEATEIFTPSTPDISKHLRSLAGTVASFNGAISKARDELSKLRTYDVRGTGLKSGSADFFLLFAAGQKPRVKFVSGAEALRAAAGRLAGLPYREPFPANSQAKVLRRGTLRCVQGVAACDFVLLAPNAVHSVE